MYVVFVSVIVLLYKYVFILPVAIFHNRSEVKKRENMSSGFSGISTVGPVGEVKLFIVT